MIPSATTCRHGPAHRASHPGSSQEVCSFTDRFPGGTSLSLRRAWFVVRPSQAQGRATQASKPGKSFQHTFFRDGDEIKSASGRSHVRQNASLHREFQARVLANSATNAGFIYARFLSHPELRQTQTIAPRNVALCECGGLDHQTRLYPVIVGAIGNVGTTRPDSGCPPWRCRATCNEVKGRSENGRNAVNR